MRYKGRIKRIRKRPGTNNGLMAALTRRTMKKYSNRHYKRGRR